MKTWVLIFAIWLTAEKGGVAIDHIEFSSRAACEAAGRAMTAEWSRGGWRDLARWVCVEDAPSRVPGKEGR
jgi:hypothetical protein